MYNVGWWQRKSRNARITVKRGRVLRYRYR